MKRLPFSKVIKEAELIPPFYGVAWVDYMSHDATCFPVPFNLVAALVRGFYFFLRHGWRSMYNNPRAAFHQGVREGERRASDPNRPSCYYCDWPPRDGGA